STLPSTIKTWLPLPKWTVRTVAAAPTQNSFAYPNRPEASGRPARTARHEGGQPGRTRKHHKHGHGRLLRALHSPGLGKARCIRDHSRQGGPHGHGVQL